jgi:maltose alpha-D-glucosyltransferase/alpha-amylase
VGELPYLLTLQPYSFFWFDLLPAAQESAGLQAAPPEFLTLVMPRNWADLFRQHTQQQLEKEAIPAFLPRQRWFGEKDQRIKGSSVRAHGEIVRQFEDGSGSETFLAAIVDAQLASGARPRYFLPLTAIWSPAETDLRQGLIPITLAELRQSRKEGALVDAFSQDGFALAVIDAIQREARVPLEGGEIRCRKTPGFDQSTLPERFVVRRASTEQSNSSVFFEEYGMLKLYRRLQPGAHPEIEMSRFLVERAGFANTPPLLATLEIALDGESGPEQHALGVLFGFIRNQGDGWTQALNYLTRYLDDALSTGEDPSNLADPDVFFLMLARQLGIRTAEMHRALAEHAGDDSDFAPEPISPEDIAEWRDALAAAAAHMLSGLERGRSNLPAATQDLVDRVLERRDALFERIPRLIPDTLEAQKTRYHGDFHLGQVIVVQNDFFIIDFEGEPARALSERRRKGPPLRDVAGMIRSFDYAAVAAVRELAEARPAAEPRMTELAEAWRQRAVDGFRAAYRKTMRGCAAYPASKKQTREMTAFFMLEKAVYEVSYELANRPGWVDIPLKGILGILAKTERGERAAEA